MFSKISNYVTDLIYETMPDVKPERREIIEYGVYMSVSEFVKIGLIVIIAVILHIVPYVFGVIGIYGIQRMFLGGIHAKTHWGCVLTHSIIVFGVVALSFVSKMDRLYILPFVALFSYISAYRYAPADLPQKPVKSKKQRRYLRIGGVILLTGLFTAALYVSQTWSNIILFSCFIQALFMTPLAYKFSKNRYGREEVIA